MKNKQTMLNDKDLNDVNGGTKLGDSVKCLNDFDIDIVYCTYYKGLNDINTRACSNCLCLLRKTNGVFCSNNRTPDKTH